MTGHIWDRQMESFMLFQSATPAECLFTFPTGKLILYCVDPFMIFKSPLSVNDWSHLEQANGVFHALSMCHSSWMSCHILNRQMTSLLCGSFHDFQITTICKWLVTFWTGKLSLACSFKVPLQLNVLSHFKQANYFSTVWTICRWLVTFGTGKGERLGKSGIPVSRELKYPGKLTPLFANNAQNIKPFTFHASGLFFKVEFLLDTQPFIFLENNLTTDGASV